MAVSFTGTAHLYNDDGSTWGGAGGVSACIFAEFPDVVSERAVFGAFGGGSHQHFAIVTNSSGRIRVIGGNSTDDGVEDLLGGAGPTISAGVSYFIAVSTQSEAGTLYIQPSDHSSGLVDYPFSMNSSFAGFDLIVGTANAGAGGESLKDTIVGFKMWRASLSEVEWEDESEAFTHVRSADIRRALRMENPGNVTTDATSASWSISGTGTTNDESDPSLGGGAPPARLRTLMGVGV